MDANMNLLHFKCIGKDYMITLEFPRGANQELLRVR